MLYPDNLSYLNADRNRIMQINRYNEIDNRRFFGIRGDYIASYYENNKRKTIEEYLIKDTNSFTLETQLNWWLFLYSLQVESTIALFWVRKTVTKYLMGKKPPFQNISREYRTFSKPWTTF